MMLGYKATHGPFDPPQRARERFAGEQARPVPNLASRAIYRGPADEPATAAKAGGSTSLGYFRCISAADDNLGRLLATLDELGLADDTIVIFNSDNGGNVHSNVPDTAKTAKAEQNKSGPLADWRKWAGDLPPTSNFPLRDGKGTLYEGGVRVPAFATWPGHIQPGITINEPLHMVDWFPTLLKLVGAKTDQPLPPDGLDLWPVLTAGAKSPHDAILLNTTPKNGALRMGDWKLVVGGNLADGDEGAAARANCVSQAAIDGSALGTHAHHLHNTD
mgnify:CR=1 FL=1